MSHRCSNLQDLGNALAGSWKLSGGASGTVRFEWAEGGQFLMQHVDIVVFDRAVKGLEMIGHLHRAGEEPSPEIWSRFYHFSAGLTLDYVYELDGRNLTIWFMNKGSNNRFQGIFAADGNSYQGAWAWPRGGYSLTATRVN